MVEDIKTTTTRKVNSKAEPGAAARLNPTICRHLELEMQTLQNAPRDADKLERLLKIKKREKHKAMHIEKTQKG
jgi:hypothetical protein